MNASESAVRWKTSVKFKDRNRELCKVEGFMGVVDDAHVGVDWYVAVGERVVRWGECDDRDEAKRRVERVIATEQEANR